MGRIRPARAIGEPWRDGHGARSDDDSEELGGAGAHISGEVASRVQALRERGARRQRPKAQAPPKRKAPASRPARRAASPAPPLPGAAQFSGGDAADAHLAYGDAVAAWRRLAPR